jgi:hypothetical protein
MWEGATHVTLKSGNTAKWEMMASGRLLSVGRGGAEGEGEGEEEGDAHQDHLMHVWFIQNY